MSDPSFFDEASEVSVVKSAIVQKYFWAWAKIMASRSRDKKIAYMDLFAGPGRYKNGTKSTPLLILETAIADPDMREKLVTFFNDADADNTQSLKTAFASISGINDLKYKPVINNGEVDEEFVKMFEKTALVPTFLFVDPWGYKGLSLNLINSVLKDWGCDCIFFFNYNRINMGLNNEYVEEHMNALFGKKRASELRVQLKSLSSDERELAIVEAISQALKEKGGNYVLPFRFSNAKGTRTSHHLIFVSKHVLGYTIMKGIMAKESSYIDEGVSKFEYNPATKSQPLLFSLASPLEELGNILLSDFAGKKLAMSDVFNRHHVGTPYIESNYKTALGQLEIAGKIIADPPMPKRPKGTFAGKVVVTFPLK